MKYLAIASALLMIVNPASAQDVKKAVYKPEIDEVVVRALDLTQFKQEGDREPGVIPVGLEGKTLVHIYDAKTDTWKYVKPSNTK